MTQLRERMAAAALERARPDAAREIARKLVDAAGRHDATQ